eukprot:TRINITY_DN16821_c0_g1_i1.p1 TRINITY_DN16821_c0_g1~~TRINITY_DN16821_c0_g1_i1.p1  ORF type:complete len:491 (+),score=104.99 TRINITY_DN16821_c0_g1_i1:38-1474(+)
MERRDSTASSSTFSRSFSDYHLRDHRRRQVDEERAKLLFRRSSRATEDIVTPTSRLTSEKGFAEAPSKKKTLLLPRVHRKSMNSGPEPAEKAMLASLGGGYNKMFITLPQPKKVVTINTLEMGSGPPLVLLHGFSGALGFWIKNLPQLSRRFTVYAIDLLGWGRSTGSKFKGKTETEAEEYFVSSLEAWREALSLKEFYIVGHSLGGFLGCVYAMKYPERVKGMLLLEPWGLFDAPETLTDPNIIEREKAEIRDMLSPSTSPTGTPGTNYRWYGCWGVAGNPKVSKPIRPDLAALLSDVCSADVFQDYMHYCIVGNKHITEGESVWRSMCITPAGGFIPWARNSIESRIKQLAAGSVPISFVYGSKSFMHGRDFAGNKLHKLVPKLQAQLLIVSGVGHHMYMEKPHDFNFVVLTALLFTTQDTSSFLGLNNHLNMAYQKYCKHQREKEEGKPRSDSRGARGKEKAKGKSDANEDEASK